jgi:hypothetical protein
MWMQWLVEQNWEAFEVQFKPWVEFSEEALRERLTFLLHFWII